MAISIVKKIFGTKSDREVKTLYTIVEEINNIYKSLSNKSDNELIERTEEFREKLLLMADAATNEAKSQDLSKDDIKEKIHSSEQLVLEEILPEAFAIVKETCRRLKGETWNVVGQPITWEMIPYDVQRVGAVVLHR